MAFPILAALPVLFRIGTWLGKDKIFKDRLKRNVGPFWIAELSAHDRQMLLEIARGYANDPETTDQQKERNFLSLQLQAVAASARNKRGYLLFDPMSERDVAKVANYPDSVLKRALSAVADLSGLTFLFPPGEQPEEQPENPS